MNNVYYPDVDSQLVWVRWTTPATPQTMTINVSVTGRGRASQGTITANIVDLSGHDPPNPVADDRNDSHRFWNVGPSCCRLIVAGQPLRALCHSSFHSLAIFCRDVCDLGDLLRLHARSIAFDDATEKNLFKATFFPEIMV